MDNNTVYEWILNTTFTVSARSQSLYRLAAYLIHILRPGDEVLDLCCGSGPMTFWFEDHGAKVTGIDFAPYMISLARQEAILRNSAAVFIEADIFKYDLGESRYDLVACFGNSISDFPLSDFVKMVGMISRCLKPGGRFVLEYGDGHYKHLLRNAAHEGVYQETPELITYRFKEYLPETGAYVNIIRNETRGEEYERKAYIYSVPIVNAIGGISMTIDQHIAVREDYFLDIFIK